MAPILLMSTLRLRVLVQVTTVEDALCRFVSLCTHACAGSRQSFGGRATDCWMAFTGSREESWLDADLLDCYHTPLFRPQKRRIKNQTFMSTTPIKIFVADEVSDSGLQPLRDAEIGRASCRE